MAAESRKRKSIHKFDRKVGLILPGGGARCAYQVGVLKAVAEILPRRVPSPFAVLSGTSAGAINATVLACQAHLFRSAVADLVRVWSGFRSRYVFRSDAATMLKTSLLWMVTLVSGGLGPGNPRSLLDNMPLRQLLQRNIRFDAIQRSIDTGYVDALAVTAAGYGSARSVSFFQGGPDHEPWERVRRRGRRADITLNHLMASVAVPMIFPPVQIGQEYFGDGAMRQATPLSPAVRLGAERLLVIGVRKEEEDPIPDRDVVPAPSLGSVAGYMLDALFMDGLSSDLEELTRINLILNQMPGREMDTVSGPLKFIDAFIMLPSEDIREYAMRYFREMPTPVQLLMRGLGGLNYGGRQLMSYLLFESGYTRALIDLGYRDGMDRASELKAFLEGKPVESDTGIQGWQDLSDEYTSRQRALRIEDFPELSG